LPSRSERFFVCRSQIRQLASLLILDPLRPTIDMKEKTGHGLGIQKLDQG